MRKRRGRDSPRPGRAPGEKAGKAKRITRILKRSTTLSIFDELRLWWYGYCPKHLCEKVMTEPSVGRLCPECELERMRARQDAIARIAAKGGKCGVCGGDHKDYMVHGAALPTRELPDCATLKSREADGADEGDTRGEESLEDHNIQGLGAYRDVFDADGEQ